MCVCVCARARARERQNDSMCCFIRAMSSANLGDPAQAICERDQAPVLCRRVGRETRESLSPLSGRAQIQGRLLCKQAVLPVAMVQHNFPRNRSRGSCHGNVHYLLFQGRKVVTDCIIHLSVALKISLRVGGNPKDIQVTVVYTVTFSFTVMLTECLCVILSLHDCICLITTTVCVMR